MDSLCHLEQISATQIQAKWAGESLQLHSDFSLQIAEKYCVVSDLHLGKVQHFRKNGIAIPTALRAEGFLQLDRLVQRHRPANLVFLGDLFHSDPNSEWNEFFNWMELRPEINFILVVGNHDRQFTHSSYAQRIESVAELQIGPYLLLHEEDKERPDAFQISGHIHPKVRIRGKARQSISMPCFHFEKRNLYLPAFGQFTGGMHIKAQKGSKSVGLAANKLWPLEH